MVRPTAYASRARFVCVRRVWLGQPCAQAERGPLASLPGERIRPSELDETTLRRAPVNDVWAQDTQSRQSVGIQSRHGHVFDISLARGWLSVGKARCAIYVGWNVTRAVPNRPKGDEIKKNARVTLKRSKRPMKGARSSNQKEAENKRDY